VLGKKEEPAKSEASTSEQKPLNPSDKV